MSLLSINIRQWGRCIKWSKNSPFNKWCWEIWTAKCKKNETQWPSYTIHRNKLKMDKRLKYVSHDTIKFLEENIGRKISDIPCSNIVTDTSPRAREKKERINKWDLITLKSFCMARENISKMNREPVLWQNIIANDTSDKGWSPKYIKNSHKSIPGKQTILLKTGQRTWTDASPRRTYRGPRGWKNTQHH